MNQTLPFITVAPTTEAYKKDLNNCKKLVLVCAGRYAKHIAELEEFVPILQKIEFFVDNDPSKKNITISNKTFDVFPFEKLSCLTQDYTLIITPVTYQEILSLLTPYVQGKNVSIYWLYHILEPILDEKELKRKVPDNLRRLNYQAIPKKIHYCWFGGNPIPAKYREYMASWKKFCPDYEIIEWNESNYDVTKNKYMYQAYKAKKWAFVSDYARLDIVYEHGGVYFDTDVELVANIDDLLYQTGFMGFHRDGRVATGLGIGAVKGNTLIKELRDCYDNIDFVKADGTLNLTPCPNIQTPYLISKGLIKNAEYQIVDDIAIYPEKVLNGKPGANRKPTYAPYTKANHHFEGSWVTELRRNQVNEQKEAVENINKAQKMNRGVSLYNIKRYENLAEHSAFYKRNMQAFFCKKMQRRAA